MKKEVKWMSVKEYVEDYNSKNDDKITRHNVYKMIADSELKAEKNERGHWVIKIETEIPTEYTAKEYVEKYNKKHAKNPIDIKQVREMAKKGDIKAKKVLGKWVITEDPSKSIKRK